MARWPAGTLVVFEGTFRETFGELLTCNYEAVEFRPRDASAASQPDERTRVTRAEPAPGDSRSVPTDSCWEQPFHPAIQDEFGGSPAYPVCSVSMGGIPYIGRRVDARPGSRCSAALPIVLSPLLSGVDSRDLLVFIAAPPSASIDCALALCDRRYSPGKGV